MIDAVNDYLSGHREKGFMLTRQFFALGKPFLLRTEIWDTFQTFCEENQWPEMIDSPVAEALYASQEATIEKPWLYFSIRPRIGRWGYARIHADTLQAESVAASDYLAFKERLASGGVHGTGWTLEIDLEPFNRNFPRMHESRSIGRGVEFLNRKLSSQLFIDIEQSARLLIDFMRVHQVRGQQLLLADRIKDVGQLRQSLRRMDDYLSSKPPETPWSQLRDKAAALGFEPGWGKDARTVQETMTLLSDTLEAPDPQTLEKFLARAPMIFSIVILSPHGYFGQDNVLGLPDTGGQVVYILDQVRALEKEMRARIETHGLDIEPQILIVTRLLPESPPGATCDQRTENVNGCRNARILRVPFRNEAGDVVPYWISRFKIWPYLERFAAEVGQEVIGELSGRPDLIIGNYSDGNLVATLLSSQLKVTQCNIAHALEKTKYLYSDLYWKDNEEKYHFSCQFTADLIAMNTADFIITSTYQEISGRVDSVGQYESYQTFTMPGLFRVVNGIDVFDPKFNIVSPGADADVYFPYTDGDRRITGIHGELRDLIYGDAPRNDIRGNFAEPEKPLLFTMARMDRIKNITGLVDWFGASETLREKVNLLVVAGSVDPNNSSDAEERDQIQRMHDLMDHYQLDGQLRWIGARLDKQVAGELYRYIADSRGAFVQPALFEAFGLTVIEAMATGLPTFATCFGGPLEIIEHGVSGFHINPNRGAEAAAIVADFFAECEKDPAVWDRVSEGSVRRVARRYTWDLYAERIMTLSRIYGFWKFATNLERDETRRYLETLYGLLYRKMAETVPH
jgi:sucrose synthase